MILPVFFLYQATLNLIFQDCPRVKRGGGIFIYVHEHYSVSSVQWSYSNYVSTFEHGSVVVHDKLNGNKYVIAGIYRSKSNMADFVNEFHDYCNSLTKFCVTHDCQLVLAGDFNIDMLKASHCSDVLSYLDSVFSQGLYPAIFVPMRLFKNSATLIDNFFINKPSFLNSGAIRYEVADHLPIFLVLSSSVMKSKENEISYKSRPICKKHITEINNCLSIMDWDFLTELTSTHEDYDMLVQRVLNTINKVAPVKTKGTVGKQNSKPWLTSGIMTSIKHMRKLYYDSLVNPDLWDSYKLYRNKLNKIVKNAKHCYYSNFIYQHRSNVKKIWQIINEQFYKNPVMTPNKNMSADELNDYFVNLGPNAVKGIQPQNIFNNYLQNRVSNSFFIMPVVNVEIINFANSFAPKAYVLFL